MATMTIPVVIESDAAQAIVTLLDGAVSATMKFLPGGGKRVVTDADRETYRAAAELLCNALTRILETAKGEKQDGPDAIAGHDHGCAEIRDDVCEGKGQGERPSFSGLGESGTGSAIDTDGFDAQGT